MECMSVTKTGALKAYLRLVAELPRLDEAAQAALERRHRAGDEAASQALIESFLSYVVAEACACRGRGLRFEALIAAGNRGLSEALRQKSGPLQTRVRRAVGLHLREALARAKSRRAEAL
jgi:DNA-directed RNA polymerase sigma subunit (sigma70/sigma32)